MLSKVVYSFSGRRSYLQSLTAFCSSQSLHRSNSHLPPHNNTYNNINHHLLSTGRYSHSCSSGSNHGDKKASSSSSSSDHLSSLIPEEQPVVTGYSLALQRAANIMVNVGERSMMKVLQWPIDDELITFLGKSSVFAIDGATTDDIIYNKCKKMKQYSNVELMNSSSLDIVDSELPFRTSAYQLIIHMLPINNNNNYNHNNNQHTNSNGDGNSSNSNNKIILPQISEMARCCGDKGFVLFGMEEKIWNNPDVNIISQLESNILLGLTPLSVQIIKCDGDIDYYLCLARKM